MEALIPLLGKLSGSELVLGLVIVGMGWFIKTTRVEDRQDKAQMVDAIKHLDETLDSVRNVLSAMSGKAV